MRRGRGRGVDGHPHLGKEARVGRKSRKQTDEPLASGTNAPVEAAIEIETAATVAAAVARLPPRQRQVVVMRIWNGMSFAEIAESIGGREATARSHMHLGLNAMRRYLEPRLRD